MTILIQKMLQSQFQSKLKRLKFSGTQFSLIQKCAIQFCSLLCRFNPLSWYGCQGSDAKSQGRLPFRASFTLSSRLVQNHLQMLGWRYEQTTRFFGTSIGELNSTEWKIQKFSVTQIFCEINFGKTRSAKICHFATLRGSEF